MSAKASWGSVRRGIRAEERAATLREVESWLREQRQEAIFSTDQAADALAAHFNPEAEYE